MGISPLDPLERLRAGLIAQEAATAELRRATGRLKIVLILCWAVLVLQIVALFATVAGWVDR